ncbi:MAG: winged helix-turn-helix domain-containing protein [Myxococcota bacterium]
MPPQDRRERVVHLSDGHIALDEGTAVRHGQSIEFTRTEWRLLKFLHEQATPVPFRTLLNEVWGYAEASSSRAPYVAIQRLRSKIEVDPRAPVHLRSVPGSGYQLVGSAETAPAAPPVATELFGREDDLASLQALFQASGGFLLVFGPAGVGKTTLVKAAQERGLLGTVVMADASIPDTPLLSLIASAYELSADIDAALALPRTMARRGPHTLVIDNAETHGDALTDWLSTPLPPETRLVVTSRIRLRLPDERVLALGPVDPAAGISIMTSVARRQNSSFELTSQDLKHLETLARDHLDGLPLALELAGGRLALMSPSDLLARIERRFQLLRGTPSGRWTSLKAAIEWSWDQLADEEQQALMQAAYFEGGFDLATAEQVIAVPHRWVVDVLQSLLDQSLLHRTDEPGRPFVLLASIRDFARSALARWPGRSDVEARHRQWAAEVARDYLVAAGELEGCDDINQESRLGTYLATQERNLWLALDSAREHEEHESAALVARTLQRLTYLRGSRSAETLSRTIEDVLSNLSIDNDLWLHLAGHQARIDLRPETLARLQALDHEGWTSIRRVSLLYSISIAARLRTDLESAKSALSQALALASKEANLPLGKRVRLKLEQIRVGVTDLSMPFQESRAICEDLVRQLGPEPSPLQAHLLDQAANRSITLGELRRAKVHIDQGLAIANAQSPILTVHLTSTLARWFLNQRDSERGDQTFIEAEEMAAAMDRWDLWWWCRLNRVELALIEARLDDATTLWNTLPPRRRLPVATATMATEAEAWFLSSQGRVAAAEQTLLAEASGIFTPQITMQLVWLAMFTGRAEEAVQRFAPLRERVPNLGPTGDAMIECVARFAEGWERHETRLVNLAAQWWSIHRLVLRHPLSPLRSGHG